MATATQRLLTAEEFGRRPDDGPPEELVRGRVIVSPPPNRRHGHTCVEIAYHLRRFLEEHDLGRVLGNDSGIITQRDPDTVRGADVVYYSYDRLPKGPLSPGYGPEVPELVFEVLSPGNRWPDLLEKVAEYLNAGSLAVAVLDPKTRAAHVYRSETPPVTLGADDLLTFPEILPGFEVVVGQLFG